MAKKETHYLLPVLEALLRDGDTDAIKTKILDAPRYYLENLISDICRIGNVRLVEIIMSVVNSDMKPLQYPHTWANGMYWAALYGHREIVELIAKDQRDKVFTQRKVFESGLCGALHGNRRDLVDLMLGNGPIDNTFWTYALYSACASGSRAMVDLVLSNGVAWFGEGVKGAYYSGNNELIEFMISLYEKEYSRFPIRSYLEIGVIGACEGGQLDIVKGMIQFEGLKKSFESGLNAACANGHRDIVDFLLEQRNIITSTTNFESGLRNACVGGHIEIARLLIAKGARDVNGAMRDACKFGRLGCARLMIEHGANDLHYLMGFKYYELAARMINIASEPIKDVYKNDLRNALNGYILPTISLSQIAHLLDHGANIDFPFLTTRRNNRCARVAEIIIEQTKGVSTYDEKNITDIITSYIGFEIIKRGPTRKPARKRKRKTQ